MAHISRINIPTRWLFSFHLLISTYPPSYLVPPNPPRTKRRPTFFPLPPACVYPHEGTNTFLQKIAMHTTEYVWPVLRSSRYVLIYRMYVGTTGRLLAWSHFVCKIPLPTDSLSTSITRVERDYLWCVNININIYCDTLLSLSLASAHAFILLSALTVGIPWYRLVISSLHCSMEREEGMAAESRYFNPSLTKNG